MNVLRKCGLNECRELYGRVMDVSMGKRVLAVTHNDAKTNNNVASLLSPPKIRGPVK